MESEQWTHSPELKPPNEQIPKDWISGVSSSISTDVSGPPVVRRKLNCKMIGGIPRQST
eukprot:COSAG02_NODE_20967_length_808_cov_0.741890_1_plen_58_part_01